MKWITFDSCVQNLVQMYKDGVFQIMWFMGITLSSILFGLDLSSEISRDQISDKGINLNLNSI